ncbi:MAG: FHIPEP family type III secretion protein [Dysosmobacter sp.]
MSSTRLILRDGGYAGVVIKAFGNLITQGNLVIGVLIFLIIVLVQFIVITKGAERVSRGGRPLHPGRHARQADGH